MAKFRAVIRGNSGGIARLGNRLIEASVNGWDVGIDVKGYIASDGREVFAVSLTNGSPSESKEHRVIKTFFFSKTDVELIQALAQ